MRKLFFVIVILCLLYFIGGWVASNFGYIDQQNYWKYGGIVGSVASVLGLLALAVRPIAQSDIEKLEVETLTKLAEHNKDLQQKAAEKQIAESQVELLERQKEKLQFLIHKASLSLFLKEQLSNYSNKVADFVSKSDELKNDLQEIKKLRGKITALDEEIEESDNSWLISELLEAMSKKRDYPVGIETIKSPYLRQITKMLYDVAQSLATTGTKISIKS